MKMTLSRRGFLSASAACAILPSLSRAQTTDAPPAPASPRPSVETCAKPAAVSLIALSPDGKRVATVTQKGDIKILIAYNIGGATIQPVVLGPSKVRDLIWGDNDHVVVVESTTTVLPKFVGRQEFTQARIIDISTGKAKTLFSDMEGYYNIVANGVTRIKVDGEYRVAASNYYFSPGVQTFTPPQSLFSFPMSGSAGHRIYEGPTEVHHWLIRPDGYLTAYSEFIDDRKAWQLYVNMAAPGKSSDFKIVYSVQEPIYPPILYGLGRDGESVLIYLQTGENAGEYHEVSRTGVLSPPIAPDNDGQIQDALFHPATGRLAGFMQEDDWYSYNYSDPLLKKLADALPQAFEDGDRVSIADMAEDPRKMIVYRENATDAGSYFFIDFATGVVEPVAGNYPALPEDWISHKQVIAYKAQDGMDIRGYLTLPPHRDSTGLPLIVLPHGGPHARDYIGFDWQAQTLASLGYAVLQPNFRGSTGYGNAFMTAGDGEWGRKMQTDLSDGVRYLAKQGTIDPKRVAIMGASYGGYAAMAGATLDRGVYTCAVAIAGVSDVPSFLQYQRDNNATSGDDSLMLNWRKQFGDPGRYAAISPARQAASASCPVLLIHGTDDTVVPIDQSKRMESALKAAGKDVQFITYKGQDHWETIPSARVTMMQAAVDFLAKYNPA